MKSHYLYIILLFICLFASCNSNQKSKQNQTDSIISFDYHKSNAVGPESLVSILSIKNKKLIESLMKNPQRLSIEYIGGIYNIDSLYFPRPLFEIYDFKDSSLIFEQDVFCLKGYSDTFIDSIMQKTREEISINFVDTLTNEKWIITRGKVN